MNIYEGDNPLLNQLLDYYALRKNTADRKTALVYRVQESHTELNKRFLKIILKDRHGNKVVGRLFNPDNETSLMVGMTGKVVNVSYEAQEYGGDINLTIRDVELLGDEFQELKEYFTGIVENHSNLANDILSQLPTQYVVTEQLKASNILGKIANKSIIEYSSKVGSKLEHINIMLQHLKLHGLTPNELAMYTMVEAYVFDDDLTLDTTLNNSKLKNATIFSATLTHMKADDNLTLLANHLMQVRLGLDEPSTLMEHIVVKVDRSLKALQTLRMEFNAMDKGSYRLHKEGKLIKNVLEE